MVQIVFSPKWFWGKDIFIDFIGLFVLVVIAVYSMKYYMMKKNKNYLFLALSFYLIAFAFLSKILTNFTIYYGVLETTTIGLLTITYTRIKNSEILFIIGFFFYRLFYTFGIYTLYAIYEKQSRLNIALMSFFILAVTALSISPFSYYIFHISSLILLGIVTYKYYETYRKNRYKATKMLASSFAVITSSHLFFMLTNAQTNFYAVAEVIQLIGYVALLITFIMVLGHGREKDKD